MSFEGLKVRVGADIGGTFTDVVLECGERLHSVKVLTDHAEPESAIVDGVGRVCREAEIPESAIDLLIHGTTLATNALIERRGAKTAFVTTAGFRDVIEMRNEGRFEQYDLNLVLPPPLVSREHRFPVAGRIAASGHELVPLDEDALAALGRRIRDEGYQSVAIGFIHSYVNGAHERRAREIIGEQIPGVAMSISCEVSPQVREFERFNTVCANAFVKPLMSSYLRRLAAGLRAIGTDCPVYMIHSGGGLISIDSAIEFPVRLLESGPAGGAIFAADYAARYGLGRVLSYDMGGTTAKICLVEDCTPKTARTFEVARTYRFKKGSGMPISIPVIEMVEIGAGGGSIGWVDEMQQIRVGPDSAGSEPGPACYRRGGEQAAVTDADLVLGRLDPAGFAGGEIPLSADLAGAALERGVGDRLGMDAATAAVGICEVVDENMANAARVHAVESGRELSDFTMIAFGGAAPLHAARLCEKLGMDSVLVPPGAGVGSAIGFLRAPFAYEAVHGAYLRLSQFDAAWTNDLLSRLSQEAAQFVSAGADPDDMVFSARAYMRYQGQGWEIVVDLPMRTYGPEDGAHLRNLFESAYVHLFGRALDGLDVEVINWSVQASSPPVPAARVESPASLAEAIPGDRREIYDARLGQWVGAAIHQREGLAPGALVNGPALVVERETTTVLTSDFDAVMQVDGCLLIRRKMTEGSHE